jgi:TonB-dependent starch-binding outer membrane protein SusC
MRGNFRSNFTLFTATAAAFFGMGVGTAQAQQQGTIVGTVTDPGGQPLAAIQVQVVGTQRGAMTNQQGRFSIPGISPGERTVRASRIGLQAQTQTVTVVAGETVEVSFTLREVAVDLDAIVVSGVAGIQERRAQGASVATIDAAGLAETAPVASVANLLQARTTGLSLTGASGTSGTAQRIRIRGGGSINLNNEPLVFIDGIRMDNRQITQMDFAFTGGQAFSRLNDLDPNEIESIEVVKGPAAATLYGADGSAGVIQIFTKRGRAGTPFTQTVTLEYQQLENTWTTPANFGLCSEALTAPDSPNPLCRGQAPGTLISDAPLERYDVWRTGAARTARWSGRGGGENFGYFLTLSGNTEEGVLPNNELERFAGRANFDWIPHETLSIEVGFGLNRNRVQLPDNDNNIYGWLGGGLLGFPTTVGGPADGWYAANRQVDAIGNINQINSSLRSQPTVTVRHSPRTWLDHRLTLGADLNRTEHRKFFPRNDVGWYGTAELNSGDMEQYRDNREEVTLDYQANARHSVTDDLQAVVSAGAQILANRQDVTMAHGVGFVTNAARSVGAAAQTSADQFFVESRSAGFFGQLQLAWRDRLYLTTATRVDWNSAFGDEGNRFISPKVEASWVISEEDFMQGIIGETLSSVRLRGAWGRSGRSPDAEAALTTFEASPFAIAAGQTGSGVVPLKLGNPDLRPERGEEIELGFDVGLLNERVGLDVTWFDKRSTDLLLERPLPPSLGFDDDPWVNVGELQNTGFEVGLDAEFIRQENVGLDFRVSLSTLTQEVLDLGDIEPFGGALRVAPGLQPFARFTHVVREVDIENNRTIVSDTMEFYGNNTPDFEGSFSSTLTLFGNLRLYGQVDWMSGFYIFNNTAQFRERQFGTGERWQRRSEILTDEERLRRFGPFYPESDPGGEPLSQGVVNGEYFERGDFARLRELSLTYTLPGDWADRFGARSASVTLAGRNLALWTDYTGADPEVLQNANAAFTRTDFLTVPPARRWVVRANVTF